MCQVSQDKTEYWKRFEKSFFAIVPCFLCDICRLKQVVGRCLVKKYNKIPLDFYTLLYWPETTYCNYVGQHFISPSEQVSWLHIQPSDNSGIFFSFLFFFLETGFLPGIAELIYSFQGLWINWLLSHWLSLL